MHALGWRGVCVGLLRHVENRVSPAPTTWTLPLALTSQNFSLLIAHSVRIMLLAFAATNIA